jgi:hypothetical protein
MGHPASQSRFANTALRSLASSAKFRVDRRPDTST